MSFGVPGSISIFPRVEPPAAATVTAANNGTSLSGTTVQLGQAVGAVGDPAQLIDNREIPLAGFSIDFRGNAIDAFLDDAAALFRIADNSGNRFFNVDLLNGLYQLGDIDAINSNSFLEINETAFLVQLAASDNISIQAGFNANANTGGGAPGAYVVSTDTLGNTMQWGQDLNASQWIWTFNNNAFLIYDFNTNLFQFGDIAGVFNGTRFGIDDTAGTFNFENLAMNAVINMNGVAGFTGTVTPVNSITVNGGIVTAVS